MFEQRVRLASLAAVLAIAASGCVNFDSEVIGQAGTQPTDRVWGIDMGDVDGDGQLETIVSTSREIVTMVVCGSDCFERMSAIAVEDVRGIAAGDYNADGIDDVAVSTPLEVVVYYGGRQSPSRSTAGLRADDVSEPISGRPEVEEIFGPIEGNPWGVVGPADIDDDGVLDLVLEVSSFEYAYVSSSGPATFESTVTIATTDTASVTFRGRALADVEGDGLNELLLFRFGIGAGQIYSDLRVFGAPGFQSMGTCGILAVGDVDGDGLDDILVGDGDIHLSTGSAFEVEPTDNVTQRTGAWAVIADFDRDGDGDYAVVERPDVLTWLNGGAGGRFQAGTDHTGSRFGRFTLQISRSLFSRLVVGDVTGDGAPDIVISDASSSSAELTLLVNSSNPDDIVVPSSEKPRHNLRGSQIAGLC